MHVLNDTPTLLAPCAAAELADSLNAEADREGDAWEYIAVHDPTGIGRSYVDVYDGTERLGSL